MGLNSAGEQDIEGQISAGNLGAVTGTVDINNVASSGKVFSGEPLTSASTIPTSGLNGRGNPFILAEGLQTDTLSYYIVDDSTALLLEMDGSRVLTGRFNQLDFNSLQNTLAFYSSMLSVKRTWTALSDDWHQLVRSRRLPYGSMELTAARDSLILRELTASISRFRRH